MVQIESLDEVSCALGMAYSNSLATQVTPAVGSGPAPRFPQQELRTISCALGMALYSNSLATQVSQPVGSTYSALSHNKIYLHCLGEGHT